MKRDTHTHIEFNFYKKDNTTQRTLSHLPRLLLHVRGQVIRGVVDVDKGPVDDGHRLEHVLETLTGGLY